ncbi:MAG: hypothetical protein EOO01_23435 [Chitinophagaceae bacterium]|nr:MAG: hypothetical protein EOO01_23435 [Chitinophagaceae bacterium]
MSNNHFEVNSAAVALSYTYSESVAYLLYSAIDTMPDVDECLYRMGDVSLPALEKGGVDGDTRALEIMWKIGTPNAARALCSFIWKDDHNSVIASYLLADLLKIPNIENTLKTMNLPQTARAAAKVEWAWGPFDEYGNLPLSQIVGRLVHKVHNSSVPQALTHLLLELDHRLTVPLSIIDGSLSLPENTDAKLILDSELLSDREKERIVKWEKIVSKTDLFEVFAKREDHHAKFDLIRSFYQVKSTFSRFSEIIDPAFLYKLLRTHNVGRKPTREDWVNIFKKHEYDFNTGPQYKWLFVLFVLFNISAISYCSYSIFHFYPVLSFFNICKAILIVLYGSALVYFSFFKFEDNEPFVKNADSLLVIAVLGWGLPFLYIRDRILRQDSFRRSDLFIIMVASLWLPFVLFYSFKTVNFFVSSKLAWGFFAGTLCMVYVLVRRGFFLERRAANPLKGILDAIGGQRGRNRMVTDLHSIMKQRQST